MAYPTLVAADLTPQLIQEGQRFLQTLDEAKIPIPAAFWYLRDEEKGWRLILATPDLERLWSRGFYRQMDELLEGMEPQELTSTIVEWVGLNDRRVMALRGFVDTGPEMAAIRLKGNAINNLYIPDLLIYRLSLK